IAYFIPVVRSLPVFGSVAARDWAWSFDSSPAYVAVGIIVGPATSIHMLLGAILGWGILSPIAKMKGWAPGNIENWDDGARGWIFWVGMGFILGDAAVEQPKDASAPDDSWPHTSLVSNRLSTWCITSVFVGSFLGLLWLYYGVVPWHSLALGILLIPFASLISMRSLGETDTAATTAIGRGTQALYGAIIPSSHPHNIIINLAMAGVVEAGAWQASQQMGDLKTAHLTRTPPRAIYFGQMLGSFAGCFVATIIYKLYSTVKTIPSDEFPVPDAHIWLAGAQLMYGKGLPPGTFGFALAASVLSFCFGTLKILGAGTQWQALVPSGIALAIGMIIPPALTLPRCLGAAIYIYFRRRRDTDELQLICCASGLVLGQGVFSLVNLLLGLLGVPHF
ncbi:OPT oligopeptide transporter protein-domain-containing protein, partial [Cercophora newfieldiana]